MIFIACASPLPNTSASIECRPLVRRCGLRSISAASYRIEGLLVPEFCNSTVAVDVYWIWWEDPRGTLTDCSRAGENGFQALNDGTMNAYYEARSRHIAKEGGRSCSLSHWQLGNAVFLYQSCTVSVSSSSLYTTAKVALRYDIIYLTGQLGNLANQARKLTK